MKASLITVHTGPNYGTVLQVIATVTVLKKEGIETTVVNYIPPRDTLGRLLSKQLKNLNAPNIIKKMYGTVVQVIRYYKNKHLYIGTLKKYCHLSRPIYSKDCFAKKCPKADLYITGSDQVWNTYYNEGVDTHYFFGDIGNGNIKVTFSSSIGMDSFTEGEKRLFKEYLSDYNSITVRERKAVELLEEIGIKSIQVLDPTLLLDKKGWSEFVQVQRLVKEKYMLLYIPYNIQDKQVIYNYAHKVASNNQLRLVSFYEDTDSSDNIVIKKASPLEFLSLMYYADYVITNSFHGTAFSINFNKQFSVFMPSRFTSRIESLLKLCGLENRIHDREMVSAQLFQDEEIDYSSVNRVLDNQRIKMREIIKSWKNL